jgi:hypothetical protein
MITCLCKNNNIFCKLYLFYDAQEKCRQRAVDKVKDQCCIYQQKLYTPFSKIRDYNIKQSYRKSNVNFTNIAIIC